MKKELITSIKNDLSIKSMLLSEIIKKNKINYNNKEIIDTINYLYTNNFIIKERKNLDIVFYLNIEKKIEDIFIPNNFDDNSDYHSISKLARKFRSSRFHVERDVIINNFLFSLKLEKQNNIYYIKYVSSFDFFKKNNIFDDILNIDDSIRIVTFDETVKLSICKLFDDFIKNKYGKEGYIAFKKNHSFNILTLEQFFKKTTWKNLLK